MPSKRSLQYGSNIKFFFNIGHIFSYFTFRKSLIFAHNVTRFLRRIFTFLYPTPQVFITLSRGLYHYYDFISMADFLSIFMMQLIADCSLTKTCYTYFCCILSSSCKSRQRSRIRSRIMITDPRSQIQDSRILYRSTPCRLVSNMMTEL